MNVVGLTKEAVVALIASTPDCALFTPSDISLISSSNDCVAEFNELKELAAGPPVIVTEPLISKLEPSHFKCLVPPEFTSDAFAVPLSYPKNIPAPS